MEERTNLARYAANKSREIEIFDLPVLVPRGEVTQLSVIPIISKPHLWTNEEDFAVENDDSTVVCYALVNYWPVQTITKLLQRMILVSVSSHSKVAYDSLNAFIL